MTKSAMALVMALGVFMSACGDEETGDTSSSLEIEGEWISNFGDTPEVISNDSWDVESEDYPSSSEIVEFSNDDNALVLLGEDGTYGQTVWTEIEGDSFYYCGVSFGKATAEEAADEAQAFDDSDPESGGCGDSGFTWTKLTRR
jgi:hypothetical protein